MVTIIKRLIILISCVFSYAAHAGIYVALAPAQIKIITPAASSKPSVMDFRLGYSYQSHQLEIVSMSSLQEDDVNQLITDVPSVQSIFYRYSSSTQEQIVSYFIIGSSQLEITSQYPGVAEFTETFQGVSVGIGFEEAFQSIPQLKIKLDWIRLYSGDQLDVNAINLGLRYAF